MRIRTLMGAVALALTLLPAAASADWWVAPTIGGHFSGASNQSLAPGADADTTPWSAGVGGGWVRGWIGVDADLAYHPQFFDAAGGFTTDRSLTTLMANARVLVPWGGRLRPFGTFGVGMIRPSLSEPGGLAKVDDAKFGWNVGGGATAMVTRRVGIQGDVRYFRATDDTASTNAFGLSFDGFDFVRASAGVAFTW